MADEHIPHKPDPKLGDVVAADVRIGSAVLPNKDRVEVWSFGVPRTSEEVEAMTMPLHNRILEEQVPTMDNDDNTYLVEEDVTETLPDGRTIQRAAKGTRMPLAVARQMGLVKDAKQPAAPSETKEEAPAETKEEKPAETKADESKPKK